MLTCKQITELVTEYADGGLTLGDRIRFQLHIGMCRNCRRYVAQVRTTTKALHRLPPPEIPPELESELMRRFEDWKTHRE